MTITTMNHFLSELIKNFPGFKAKITDKESFVKNWMATYGDRDENLMDEARRIYIEKGNRYFPTTDEFKMSLILAEFRLNLKDQLEYERSHPTSETDQELIDYLIEDIFEGVEDD